MKSIFLSVLLSATATGMVAAQAEVRTSADGRIVVGSAENTRVKIDFANAKPMPLPMVKKAPMSQFDAWLAARKSSKAYRAPPTVVLGTEGNGVKTPTSVPPSKALSEKPSVSPSEYGSSGQVYTTSRAAFDVTNPPERRTGKLFFNIGSDTYVCSASIIKTGVLVTAAHCVSDFGAQTFYSNWMFIPAYKNGDAPYGVWTTKYAAVKSSYYNGTDSCAVAGVVCENDVAVLVLKAKQGGAYLGTQTGTNGYEYGGYGYNSDQQVLITQLGYPVALDNGGIMERTDSQGYVDPSSSNNTVIGSLMTGGSSGGPWLVNYGARPTLSGGAGFGTDGFVHTVTAGVTSWGYTDISSSSPKQQGASYFTSNNIQSLLDFVCGKFPGACN